MSSSRKFSAGRPKRAADTFTRTHHLEGGEPSTKKPRFDLRNPLTLAPDAEEEEEDLILAADVIGKRAGFKRNAVNLDGYDSDSSTENFDARAEARAKAKEAPLKDEEDDDMFAKPEQDNQEEDARRGERKKKPVRFMEYHEIEGQEDTSKSGGHVAGNFSADSTDDIESSSESGDDEERDRMGSDIDEELGAGGKKRHAPKVDAFNMRAEQEEGRFDEAGNFVRKAYSPEAAHDAWLDGVSKKDIKRAKEAHEKREAEQKKRDRAEDSISLSDVLSTMIAHLDIGETPMEALVRLGKAVPKKKTKSFNKHKKSEPMDVEQDPAEDLAATKAKEAIDAITESASRLTDRGVEDVYDLPRERMMRQYWRETGEMWKDPNPKWEFHWLAAPEEEIYGPYDVQTMRAWQENGHFEAGAEFRLVGGDEWTRLLNLD